MLYIGCHLSSSKGFLHMGEEALSIGGNVFQFFTRNPRGGAAKPLDEQDAAALRTFMEEHSFGPILAHAPYTMNVCAADPGLRKFAKDILADDIRRMEYLPGNMYNFHPGSHVGQGTEQGCAYIIQTLNEVLTAEQSTTILLETMAGKGSEIGGTFEELRTILDGVKHSGKMGVCLDTCHVHDGGYDIVNDLDGVLNEFDRVIGLPYLKAIHLNDSKNPRAAHKDRHETIGNGAIGLDALTRIINHPVLRSLPFYLETPNELPGYKTEITLMRSRFK